jgi:hypothetical protein
MTVVCISMTLLSAIKQRLMEWFVYNKVPEMDWPAQSPDLNSIEHLWDELERRFCSKPQCPTFLTALATAMQEEWATIPQETPGRKSPWQSSSHHKGKGWAHLILTSTTGKCVTGKVRLQFRVGVRTHLIR